MELPGTYQKMKSHSRLPFPGQRKPQMKTISSSAPELTRKPFIHFTGMSKKEIVTSIGHFSFQNPQDFEQYIIENICLETLSKWLAKKKFLLFMQGKPVKSSKSKPDSRNKSNKFYSYMEDLATDSKANCIKRIERLKNGLESGNYLQPLYRFCSHLQTMTISSGFSFYTSDGRGDSLHLYNPDLSHWTIISSLKKTTSDITASYFVGAKSTIALHAAHTMQPVVVDDLPMDERFPKGVPVHEAVSVMCLPLIFPNGDLLGVIELYRSWDGAPYTPDTLTVAQNYLHWAMLAVYETEISSGLQQQSEMSEFLLEVSRKYLDDLSDIDSIVRHIMRFAKSLVSAKRCALFLLDKETEELYSSLFDVGEEENGETIFIKQAEIRFPISKGIAGNTAKTKRVLNIPNAYADKRFNKDVDKLTGFTTESILCIPIMGDNEVYGVVEMINKKGGGAFTITDQNNFQLFAVFCALALRYSKVHSRMLQDQCRFHTIKEQYLYHSAYSENDFKTLLAQSQNKKILEKVIPMDFDDFHFSVIPFNNELLLFCIKMLHDVTELNNGGLSLPFDVTSRFVLAVRSNYRKLPYHNWYHAVTVCHAMYCILKRHFDIFDRVERFALIVACLCHDIDHRSLSNQFLKKVDHPLAILYPYSTMEYHHLQTTLDIMARENHDIFGSLNAEDCDKAMAITRQAILATDFALYFKNRSYVEELLNKGTFTFSNQEHRTGAMDLMMTSCDMSSTAKLWDETYTNACELYQEFWAEGDKRKKLKIPLLPIMDRDLKEDFYDSQVGFYSIVVIKCFETLTRLLPKCKPMETRAKLDLERWREEADAMNLTKLEMVQNTAEEKRRQRSLNGEYINLTMKGGLWMVEESRTKFHS